MSLASAARDAVRSTPFLYDALRAGVVNYRAAAEYLDVDGDTDAVATALRRFADELDAPPASRLDAPVRMQSGVTLADADVDAETVAPEDVVVSVGDRRVVRGGDLTAIRVQGDVESATLERVLGRLRTRSVVVAAAGVVADELTVVVPRRQGATALRVVEDALAGD